MDNLVAVSKALERMPDNLLTTLVRRPNAQFPQFAVAAELQRRKQLRSASGAAQARGTVLDGLAPEAPAMPGLSAPQQYAGGGLVAFADGGKVSTLAEFYRALKASERALPPAPLVAPRSTTVLSDRFPPLAGSASETLAGKTVKSWADTKKQAVGPSAPAGLSAADVAVVPDGPQPPVLPGTAGRGAGLGAQASAGLSAALPSGPSDLGAYYDRFSKMVNIPDPTTDEIVARQKELQGALGYAFDAEKTELAKRREDAGARMTGGLDSPAMRQAMLRAGLTMMTNRDPNFLAALGSGLGAGVETYAGERDAVKKENAAIDAEERQLRRDQLADKRGLYGIASQAMNSGAANKRSAAGLAAQLAQYQAQSDRNMAMLRMQMVRAQAGGSGGAGAPGAVPIRAEDYKEIRERMAEDPQMMRAAAEFKRDLDLYNKQGGARGSEEFMRQATARYQAAQEAARVRASAGLTYYPTKVPSGAAMPGSVEFGVDMRSGAR